MYAKLELFVPRFEFAHSSHLIYFSWIADEEPRGQRPRLPKLLVEQRQE